MPYTRATTAAQIIMIEVPINMPDMRSQKLSANREPLTVSVSVLEQRNVMNSNAAVHIITPSVMRCTGILFTMRLSPLFILALRTKLHTLRAKVPATSTSIDVISRLVSNGAL